MRKIYFYIVTLLFASAFVSCKKMTEIPREYIQVEPEVLELKAGTVDAAITTKFPEKFFVKKAMLTVTPVLVSADGAEIEGTPVTYQGEKVKGNNQAIPYKAGAVVTQNASFDYEEGFDRCALFLDFQVVAGKKEYKLPRVKVADGLITTANLVNGGNLRAVLGEDQFQKSIQEVYEAEIMFLIQQANIRNSELKSKSVTDLMAQAKAAKDNEELKISGFEIEAFASPDGSTQLNYGLSQKRKDATVAYYKKELKKQGVPVEITSKFTAEDWDGFQKLMQASDIKEKQAVLNVLSRYSDPEQREVEIKKMSTVFEQLANDILPQLRRSKMKLIVETLGKTDDELISLVRSDIKSLTADEILYTTKELVKSDVDRAKYYQTVIDNYATDWRGYNNLGYIKFNEGNYKEAATLFERAYNSSNNPVTNYNLGIIALVNKDYTKASSYLAKSNGGVPDAELKDALALVQISKGSYSAAASSLDKSNSNVAALSQILVQNYTKASSTLNAIKEPDATTYYLKAVVGARTSNKDMVISNLKTSIQKDKSMAKKALNDVEFAKFFTDEAFMQLVN